MWAVLYLVLHDLPVPESVPEAWRLRWTERLGTMIPRSLHDATEPYDPIPRRETIVHNDREQLRRLLDSTSTCWW